MKIQLPNIRESDLDSRRERRRILESLYQLSEQIRYFSYHIGEENLSDELKETLAGQKTQLSELNRKLQNGITGAMSQIRQLSDSISLRVGQTESQIGLVRELSTELAVLSDSINMVFTTVDSLQQECQRLGDEAGGEKSVLQKYIRFVDGTIILGEEGNELTLHIEKDRISYRYGGMTATYFSDRRLVISSEGSVQRLEMGVEGSDPLIHLYDDDGVLQLAISQGGIRYGNGLNMTQYAVSTKRGLGFYL